MTLLCILLIIFSIVGCDKNKSVTNVVDSDNLLSIDVLDIGQGDSILVRSSGKTMLIDTGDIDGKDVIIPYLRNLGIQKLDFVFFTHPHKDHIGSGSDVIKSFNIGKVYMSSKTSTTRTYEKLLNTISSKGASIKVPNTGDNIKLGSCSIEIVGPVKKYGDMNNSSLVFKITCGATKFMFTGDMEKEAEQDLINSGVNLNADVLKVGHHGSRGASSNEFLKKVSPNIAIISCGKNNDYGHPHKEALSRLKNIRCKIYRTDELGTIKINSNGKNITITNTNNAVKVSNKNINKNKDSEKNKDSIQDKNLSSNKNNKTDKINHQVYIGNKNSKVFHSEDCRSLPKERNRVYFKTKQEAIKAGYKPCSRCNP